MVSKIHRGNSMDGLRKQSISILTSTLRELVRKSQGVIKVDCGTDSDRFVRLADDYKEAVIFQDVIGGTVRIESNDFGHLKFTFERFAKEVPASVISKVSGKSILLVYKRKEVGKWVKKPYVNTVFFTGKISNCILCLNDMLARYRWRFEKSNRRMVEKELRRIS
jgi:hypothetical protein